MNIKAFFSFIHIYFSLLHVLVAFYRDMPFDETKSWWSRSSLNTGNWMKKKKNLHNSHLLGVEHNGSHSNPMLKEANQASIWIHAPHQNISISKILNPVQSLKPKQITSEKTLYTLVYNSCLNLALRASQDIHIVDQGKKDWNLPVLLKIWRQFHS